MGKQPHTAECRERFRKVMSDDARVQLASQKRQRFEDKELERKRRKEEKREERGLKEKRMLGRVARGGVKSEGRVVLVRAAPV